MRSRSFVSLASSWSASRAHSKNVEWSWDGCSTPPGMDLGRRRHHDGLRVSALAFYLEPSLGPATALLSRSARQRTAPGHRHRADAQRGIGCAEIARSADRFELPARTAR